MRHVSVVLVFLLVCGVGVIALQMFLSKKENKWAGLILPIISFGISLMALLAVLLFSAHKGVSTLTVGGVVVEQTTAQTTEMLTIIGTALYIFLLYNIPTAVLLAIFAACGGKRKKRRDLEKMSVQDLE
ncbi:MAG: hypothetical protein LBL15_04465 [Oscillospiraceae bacterium]|jgi:hypothetical protein|nr:hypothetical protein [Oscillospiraceae bacterium]